MAVRHSLTEKLKTKKLQAEVVRTEERNIYGLNSSTYQFLLLAILNLLFFACAQVPDLKIPKNRHAPLSKASIWGGSRVDEKDVLAGRVVALMKANGFPFCTGSYIGGNAIITAAHCVFDIESPILYITFDVLTPTDLNPVYGDKGINSPNARKVTRAIPHPLFDRTKFSKQNLSKEPAAPLYDVALLEFEGEAPPMAHVVQFVPNAQVLPLNSGLTLAGYGRSDAQGGDYGRLYSVTTNLGAVRSKSREIVDGPNSEKGSCVGDSGGPVFTADTLLLAGIVSYGPTDCGMGNGFNTDLRYLNDWIQENADCANYGLACDSKFLSISDIVPDSEFSFLTRCEVISAAPLNDEWQTLHAIFQELGTQSCKEAARLALFVTKMNLSSSAISNIALLRHFVSLEDLDLSFNSLNSLSDLAYLRNLKKLNLTGSLRGMRLVAHTASLKNFRTLAEQYHTKMLASPHNLLGEAVWLSNLPGLKNIILESGVSLEIPVVYSDGRVTLRSSASFLESL